MNKNKTKKNLVKFKVSEIQMAKKEPLVSVLLCTYNAERFIVPTIKSIISQSYKNLEILILDNNSSDNTINILKELSKLDKKIKLFESKINHGAYGGLNYLMKFAKGKYIAIIDHDDIWQKNKIAIQIKFLEKNKEYVGCGCLSILYFEKNGEFILQKYKYQQKFVPHPSLVFRNEGYRYDTSILYKTDSYFMEKILCKDSKIFLFKKYFYINRVREDGGNLSKKLRNPKNIILTFIKTKDLSMLFKGLFWIIFPKFLWNTFYKILFSGKKITDLDKYGFKKEDL